MGNGHPLYSMKRPIYVRPLSDAERESLEAGLRSSDAFTLRRCQILLASDRGENAYQIVRSLGCSPRPRVTPSTPLTRRGCSKRPHAIPKKAFQRPEQTEALRELLHHDPRRFGKGTRLWTLDLAA